VPLQSPPLSSGVSSFCSEDRRLRGDLRHLALGSTGYEAEPSATGERQIWIEEVWVNRVAAMRGPGESYSDVILRLVELETKGRP
jgi:hypothetical protein